MGIYANISWRTRVERYWGGGHISFTNREWIRLRRLRHPEPRNASWADSTDIEISAQTKPRKWSTPGRNNELPPRARQIWASTLQMAAQHWTNSVLRVHTLRSTLQQLANGADFSEELLECSMLGEFSNALILGSSALSLQGQITVYSKTGELRTAAHQR